MGEKILSHESHTFGAILGDAVVLQKGVEQSKVWTSGRWYAWETAKGRVLRAFLVGIQNLFLSTVGPSKSGCVTEGINETHLSLRNEKDYNTDSHLR